ncbi:hypothetical protein [Candidatus Ichthyocystis sparus]|uniref:hypothetical protein n=1 Tax=Candidatus Ichthyocystis sparus TaxID=1561004 RepID=UPI000B81C476|nr:hypothetical protein [Candidatus Ichthyocystis sparus]
MVPFPELRLFLFFSRTAFNSSSIFFWLYGTTSGPLVLAPTLFFTSLRSVSISLGIRRTTTISCSRSSLSSLSLDLANLRLLSSSNVEGTVSAGASI